jgi:hypothetical protein
VSLMRRIENQVDHRRGSYIFHPLSWITISLASMPLTCILPRRSGTFIMVWIAPWGDRFHPSTGWCKANQECLPGGAAGPDSISTENLVGPARGTSSD